MTPSRTLVEHSWNALGVCVIISWVGTTNIIAMLTVSQLYSAPMVAIMGQVPHHISTSNTFQEMSIA
jgi:thiamine pyrophosphate-dependent acetolactate synthase large subunit-like protein